jgi:hypothetical protein
VGVRMKFLVAPLVVLALMFAGGCRRITKDDATEIKTLAESAKERASSFVLVKNSIVPVIKEDKIGVDRWIVAHGEGLAAQAKGLDDLTRAVTAQKTLHEVTVNQIKNEADTAAARAKDFSLMAPKITGATVEDAAKIEAWKIGHSSGLSNQAALLSTLSASVPPKPPKGVK